MIPRAVRAEMAALAKLSRRTYDEVNNMERDTADKTMVFVGFPATTKGIERELIISRYLIKNGIEMRDIKSIETREAQNFTSSSSTTHFRNKNVAKNAFFKMIEIAKQTCGKGGIDDMMNEMLENGIRAISCCTR